jgi:hypothetical protein
MGESTLTCVGNRRFVILGDHSSGNCKILKHKFPMGTKSGPQGSWRGGQVAYHIGVQKKVIPENFGTRTRETAKSDHPIIKGDLLENCCGCGKFSIGN